MVDFYKPFVTETDTSGISIGGVLLQDERPLLYSGIILKELRYVDIW